MVASMRRLMSPAQSPASVADRSAGPPLMAPMFLSILVLLAASGPLHGQERGLFKRVQEPPAPGTLSESVVSHELAKRFRIVEIDFAVLENLSSATPDDPRATSRLAFNLFDGTVFTGVVERREPTRSGGHAFTGRIAEDPLGTMALVVNGETVAGTVRTSRGTYRIRSAGPGRYAVSELDASKLPERCDLLPAPPPDPGTGLYGIKPTVIE